MRWGHGIECEIMNYPKALLEAWEGGNRSFRIGAACSQGIITKCFPHKRNGSPERATKGRVAGHVSVAIRVGMSPAMGGYAVQGREAIAKENDYQLIQWDIELLKGVPF